MTEKQTRLNSNRAAFTILILMSVFIANHCKLVPAYEIEHVHMIDSDLSFDQNFGPTSMLHLPLRRPNGAIRASGNVTVQGKLDTLSKVFKKSVQKIKHKQKRIDVVFLIDSSSSVGKNNFHSELKFVKKFLSDFNVSFNHTRVAIVTFSSQGKIVSEMRSVTGARLMDYGLIIIV